MSVSKIKGFIPINNGDVDVRSRVNREKGSEETYFEKEDLLKKLSPRKSLHSRFKILGRIRNLLAWRAYVCTFRHQPGFPFLYMVFHLKILLTLAKILAL